MSPGFRFGSHVVGPRNCLLRGVTSLSRADLPIAGSHVLGHQCRRELAPTLISWTTRYKCPPAASARTIESPQIARMGT